MQYWVKYYGPTSYEMFDTVLIITAIRLPKYALRSVVLIPSVLHNRKFWEQKQCK